MIENVRLEPIPGPDAPAYLILLPERERDGVVVSFTTYAEVFNADSVKVFSGDVPENIIRLDVSEGPFRFRVWDREDRVDGGLDPEPGETVIKHVRFAQPPPPPAPELKYTKVEPNLIVTFNDQDDKGRLDLPAGTYKRLRYTVEIEHRRRDLTVLVDVPAAEFQQIIGDPDPDGTGTILFSRAFDYQGVRFSPEMELRWAAQFIQRDNTARLLSIEGWYE